MDNSEETSRSESTLERVQQYIEKTFDKIRLIDYLSKDSPDKTIAILGAGAAIEIGALTRYFLRNDLNKPKIVCFDLDPVFKKLTEDSFDSQDINFEYRTSDITDPQSFKEEQYDMVIVRKPNVHKGEEEWGRAFENGFNHLKNNGIFLATTDIYADFVREQLGKRGEVIKTYIIPQEHRDTYFNEVDLFIAKKR